jgi:hypothetical protein
VTATLIPRAPATAATPRTQRGRHPARAIAIGLMMVLTGGLIATGATTDATAHHATLLAPVAAAPDDPAAASPSHTLTGFTASQEATIGWALGLFDEASLPVPGIDFVRHTTVERCHGSRGWYSGAHDRPVIRICIHEGGPVPDSLILHELAHAWDSHLLTYQRRAAFLDWRDLSQWWGDDPEHWGEYGAEQAAETIVWGVIDRPNLDSHIPAPYNHCGRLRTAYVMLTGRPPLHGYTDRCEQAESDDLADRPESGRRASSGC